MLKNRHQRRAEKVAFKKQIKNSSFDEWESIKEEAQKMNFPPSYGKLINFYKNSIYSVQVYERPLGMTLLGIRRHDQEPICPWAHKQRIKNELMGEDLWAVECFPPVKDLVDKANIFWLWVYERDMCPGFSLKEDAGFDPNSVVRRF